MKADLVLVISPETSLMNYTTYNTKLRGKRVRMYQYDYRTESGELFSCCAPTLEACRERRDKWLNSQQ